MLDDHKMISNRLITLTGVAIQNKKCKDVGAFFLHQGVEVEVIFVVRAAVSEI